ncbi:hypothetical protein [Lysobacter sp. Hz 25]|uniref:hypothetical protein n=1 Tax=Lysobacter sp. Hz 25 TaxID=3383698 RepID=UPI0038D35BDC
MSNQVAEQFLVTLNKVCNEAAYAAALGQEIFSDREESKYVRRELVELMEQIDLKIIPILRKHYPDIDGYMPLGE